MKLLLAANRPLQISSTFISMAVQGLSQWENTLHMKRPLSLVAWGLVVWWRWNFTIPTLSDGPPSPPILSRCSVLAWPDPGAHEARRPIGWLKCISAFNERSIYQGYFFRNTNEIPQLVQDFYLVSTFCCYRAVFDVVLESILKIPFTFFSVMLLTNGQTNQQQTSTTTEMKT